MRARRQRGTARGAARPGGGRRGRGWLLLLAAALAAPGCGDGSQRAAAGEAAAAAGPTQFTAVTAAAGFTHRHHKPILDHQLDPIMPWVSSVGAAAAAGDYNGDGWIDLYVTDSRRGEPNHLYRNRGDGTFTDVAAAAGLAGGNDEGGVAMDAVWGDFDNDGRPDLYVVRWGRDLLYHNDGDGTFSDVTARCFRRADGGAGSDWHNGNAAVWLDYDRDGRLDLYVGNYFRDVDLWHLDTTRIMHDSFERARNAGANQLFHQEPDGTFREVAREAGVADTGWTLAVGAADLDNDGWPDLYSADDFGADELFLGRGDGTFADASLSALGADTKKGMNVDFGDFNGDGWLDVYVTNITTAEYLQEGNMLWHNNGRGPDGRLTFTDVSLESGTSDGGWGWGAKFFDADDDGDLDLVAGNGFISAGPGSYWYDLASWTVTDKDPTDARNWPPIGDRSFSGYEALRFFRDDGLSTFTERAREVGLVSDRDNRGIVVFDYDNDGDLDLYVANQDQPPDLFRNGGVPGNHWLEVALVADPATGTNRDAVGTRVTAAVGGALLVRERDGGNGFAAQSDPRLHFGLGPAARVDLLEVRWPDGGRQYLEDVAADQLLTVRQDPAHYVAQERLAVGTPERLAAAAPAPAPVAEVAPDLLAAQLTEVEGRLLQRPPGYALASAYRARAAAAGVGERAVAFFSELVASHPDDAAARLQLGCALVDEIPTCGGVAAVVCKGTLARRALEQFDAVLAADPDSWVGHYCRGINHLHWPRALRHSDDAVADLERCVDLQERARGDAPPPPYHLRCHLALGDAYAKAGDPTNARRAWRRGLQLFPDSPALAARLAIADDDRLLAYVESQNSLEQPIDTDLSFLDQGR
jgi:enediyne biosynthesis protein E4